MAKLEHGEMWIGDLARESGETTATINYYVQMGVIPPPRKVNRTRAAYNALHLRALRLVRVAQNAHGLSLARIKRMGELWGLDEEGITKIEAIGSMQPLAPAYGDPPDATIDHFDPLPLDDFAELTGASRAFILHLETVGVLRPIRADLYDANDAWVVKTAHALVDTEGVPLEWINAFADLQPALCSVARIIDHLLLQHVDEMRDRSVRFRDLFEPLMRIVSHMAVRVHNERNPDWRDAFTAE